MRQQMYIDFCKAASAKVVNYRRLWSLLVCICLVSLCSLPCLANAQPPLNDNNIQAFTVRAILGIVSYARWPIQPAFYRLCVVGNPANVRTLSEHPNEVAGHELRVSTPNTDDNNGLSECDILYIGAMTDTQRQAILKKIKQATILTIGEGDEMCSEGMMFCLSSTGQNSTLQANLDAIARSGIRINANVLLLLRHRIKVP